MPSLAGTKLDKYEMLEEVGHGGMAVVYRATDTSLKREVAVKVLHPHLADREESRLRLQREAIAVAKLRHENILEIFDYSGETKNESYIVTEFIHGPTLREWIDETLDPRPAIAALIVYRIALALCHAHSSAIVHRDIKPENVMIRLDDGCLKLMDFGIAQLLDNQKLTLTGQLIGSPAYMAPELISGKPLDARTDLFSLGVMLYQLATGQLPFSGRNPHEVLNRIADGDYPAPSSVCPLVDRDLEAIIATTLATNPDDRYQTVEALVQELENYLEEMGLDASLEELGHYIRKPEEYVVELDERVCVALMRRAEEAAKEGSTARAIRLLGRVLELDSSRKEARALLARLRTRERRMRQALLAAGILGVGGLVAAGIMLVPPEIAMPIEDQAFAKTEVPEAPATVIPFDGKIAVKEPAPETGDTAAPDPTAAADETADTGEPTTPPDTKDGASTPPRKTGRRPPASRTPPTIECKLSLSGIAPGQLGNIKLVVDGKARSVPNLTPVLELSGNKAHGVYVQSRRFQGEVTLTPDACKSTVPLKLKAKPAKVTFANAIDSTTVRCVSGCPVSRFTPHSGFPAIDLGGQLSREVVFEVSTAGYRKATVTKVLRPGANRVVIKLGKPL